MAEKKILVRSGMMPWDPLTRRDYFVKMPYATNVGNLVYAYGVCRMLMTNPGTQIDADNYRVENGLVTNREIEEINETYSCYVIPLADAFRPTFRKKMRNLADFIRKLKIPAVVIGAGMKAPLKYELSDMEECNKSVKKFVNAVLEKSAMLGLRGEHTAEYLGSLGYRAEVDYTPIGCPSVYCMGGELPLHSPILEDGGRLDRQSSLIVTNNVFSSKAAHQFMNKVMEEYPNYVFIPQREGELRAAYFGDQMPEEFQNAEEYPSEYGKPPYSDGKVRIPFQVPTWMGLVRGADLSVGPRLHGSIMCMLSEVPTLVLPRDTRTLEVCEYHHFAHVRQTDLTDKTDLRDLVEKADFQEVSRRHAANFEHYCDFLEKNEIRHGLRTMKKCDVTPLDQKISGNREIPAVKPYCSVSLIERKRRDIEKYMVKVKTRTEK